MAEKVPSFKTGGTIWFTDLTTADTTYILPLLTAVTLLIMVESNMQEGLEGNPVAGTMKKFSRITAFLSIPVLIGIEKALFCYWLTSNLFTLGYGLAIRCPDVRKLLNLPDVVISSSTGQPSPHSPMPFSFPQRKDQSIIQEDPPLSSESSSGVPDGRISRSSVLNQRIRTLERQLKDRKKKKFQEVIVLDPDLSRDYLDLIQDRTKEKKYCFDHAYGPESTYKNVYRSMSSVFSAGVVHGLNAICMSFYWKWQNIYNG